MASWNCCPSGQAHTSSSIDGFSPGDKVTYPVKIFYYIYRRVYISLCLYLCLSISISISSYHDIDVYLSTHKLSPFLHMYHSLSNSVIHTEHTTLKDCLRSSFLYTHSAFASTGVWRYAWDGPWGERRLGHCVSILPQQWQFMCWDYSDRCRCRYLIMRSQLFDCNRRVTDRHLFSNLCHLT